MPEIAGGFVAYRYHELGVREESQESMRQIYQASLSLLYKLLFLLYAEARALLPINNPGYREQSLTTLAQWAAERLDKGLPLSDATHATARYDALLALFHRIDQGDPNLAIPRYNGGLFNPDSPENQFLEEHKLSDRAVARAVDILVRDADQPVDYAYISVRNLGAIYEGLLENRLVVKRLPKSAETLEVCQVELVDDKGERKATGSYYTPDYIVEYIVQHTLDPILDERDRQFRAAMDRCAGLRRQLQRVSDTKRVGLLREQLRGAEQEARDAFLGIKVLDPATGSGHFLVNAVDYLTDGIIQRMQAYHDDHPKVPWAWNPIQQLIERVRTEILEEMDHQGIVAHPTGDEALHLWGGPEQDGGGAGKGQPVAPLLYDRRAAQFPGPPPALGQLSHRRRRAHRRAGRPGDHKGAGRAAWYDLPVRPLCRPLCRTARLDGTDDRGGRAGRCHAGRRAPERRDL